MKTILANWKMNKNLEQVTSWLNDFLQKYEADPSLSQANILVAPNYLHLHYLSQTQNKFNLCAQDINVNLSGAFTGGVSAEQIKDFVKYTLVGHTETKSTFEQTYQKALNAINNNITPIVCLSDFENINQLPDFFNKAYIALEDPTFISNGGDYKNIDENYVQTRVQAFKSKFGNNFLGVLYGGSVNGQNAPLLGNIAELDGLLIGNASLDPEHFYQIIKLFSKV